MPSFTTHKQIIIGNGGAKTVTGTPTCFQLNTDVHQLLVLPGLELVTGPQLPQLLHEASHLLPMQLAIEDHVGDYSK